MSANQGFVEYMQSFLDTLNAKNVVEVGSDMALSLAARLSSHCEMYHVVSFPGDCVRMRGPYEMHQDLGRGNIRLIPGDALNLTSLVPKSEVIILHNVLLDGNSGEDTTLMWRYRRKESPCTEEQWKELMERFKEAEKRAYMGFLSVANPGHIITFGRTNSIGRLEKLFSGLEINPSKVETLALAYDLSEPSEDDQDWTAKIIHNV